MVRHEAETWQEGCKILLGGAVIVPARVDVWAYDGQWGGEALLQGTVALSASETAVLLLEMEGEHPVEIKSVSHRSAKETTVHFVGDGAPPFSPHAVKMARSDQKPSGERQHNL